MASREEWCADKITKLLNEELRITTLNEIKDHFTSVPQDEAARTANILQLPLVFDCLNNSNTEQVDLACEVLSLCMNNLNLGESTSKYGVSLERALTHPYASVKLMSLTEIERSLTAEQVINELCHRKTLVINIVRCLEGDDLAVVKKSSTILTKIATTEMGINLLVSSDILVVIYEVMTASEVIRLRVYELVVSISKESEENFIILQSTGLVNQILEELDNNDILLKMNILELLTQLGTSRHGYTYLESNGILNKMFLLFDENQDPVAVQLCEPGVLKFFGHIAHWRPIEVLSKYPKFFDRLFSNLETGNLTIVSVSLDTLGHIAELNEGKIALDSTGNKMKYAVKVIIKLLPSLPNDVRITALNCLEKLVKIGEYRNEISSISRKWYNLFGDIPMDLIVKYSKNPFPETRVAGLSILRAVCGHYWGHEDIRNTPGLIEFLLDRLVESVKECKEVKFEIIKILSTSEVFDQSIRTRLQTYVKEGPFYVYTVTEVAVEGND
ncbi:unnamed protein product [Brassicogethes aeneus]|uniref:26S proteasome non-ATPase regulatory subunit 5 n=1 Tax=Brassicogethes aeneus TaxID=1431903 RepID=A0A9P0AYP7_BRAAE|nr:unnamed protein product [Brassicogethes aeneus]